MALSPYEKEANSDTPEFLYQELWRRLWLEANSNEFAELRQWLQTEANYQDWPLLYALLHQVECSATASIQSSPSSLSPSAAFSRESSLASSSTLNGPTAVPSREVSPASSITLDGSGISHPDKAGDAQTVLGKRIRQDTDDQAVRRPRGLTIRIPPTRNGRIVAAGGFPPGPPGPHPNFVQQHNWTPDCHRKGDRAHRQVGGFVGQVALPDERPQQLRQLRPRQLRPRPNAHAEQIWGVNTGLLNLTEKAGLILNKLLGVSAPEFQLKVQALLELIKSSPLPQVSIANGSKSLAHTIQSIKSHKSHSMFHELFVVLSLVQLSMHFDSDCQVAAMSDQKQPSRTSCASEAGLSSWQFRRWLSKGHRWWALLCSGNFALVVVFLLLDMRKLWESDVCLLDILGVCWALRCESDRYEPWQPLMKRLIPYLTDLQLMLQEALPEYTLHYKRIEEEKGPVLEKTLLLWDLKLLDSQYDDVETQIWRLPQRSDAWFKLSTTSSDSAATEKTPDAPQAQNHFKVVYPCSWVDLQTSREKLPKGDTADWTECQRDLAISARMVHDVDTLQSSLLAQDKPYTWIEGCILPDETSSLEFRSSVGEFLGVLIRMPNNLRSGMDLAHQRVVALHPKEYYKDTSRKQDYRYGSWHHSVYNKFTEQGTNSPVDIHPSQVAKNNVQKVNQYQRFPYPSKESIQFQNHGEILADILRPISEFLDEQLSSLLSQEHQTLHTYADSLPLAGVPLAQPFLGCVLNLCVSTAAHKDKNDKGLCAVIPLGDYEGGELCLYEIGLVVEAKPGDIFIFPSAKITHFNMHFDGMRGSIVLQSDQNMENWTKNSNGWRHHMSIHGE